MITAALQGRVLCVHKKNQTVLRSLYLIHPNILIHTFKMVTTMNVHNIGLSLPMHIATTKNKEDLALITYLALKVWENIKNFKRTLD